MPHTVDVKWKKAAADLVWRGEDRQEGSAGFVLMTSPPTDKVAEILPDRASIPKQYLRELLGKKMKKAVTSHAPPGDADAIMDWLRVSATTGRMPFEREINPHHDNPASAVCQANPDIRAAWGDRVKIGAGSIKGDFFLLEGGEELESCEKFWELPPPSEHEEKASQEATMAIRNSTALPQIRYQGAPVPDPMLGRVEERHIGLVNRAAPQVLNPEALQALAGEAAVENDPGECELDEEEERPQYGAPWEQCKKGWIAVVSVDFVDKKGIDVVLITDVIETDDDGRSGTFAGARYKLDSRSLDQGDEKCLEAKWWLPPRTRRDVVNYRGWWVLEYVASLTAAGKLPASTRRSIQTTIREQNVGTFQPIPGTVNGGGSGVESGEDSDWKGPEDDQSSDSDDRSASHRRRKRPRRHGAQ